MRRQELQQPDVTPILLDPGNLAGRSQPGAHYPGRSSWALVLPSPLLAEPLQHQGRRNKPEKLTQLGAKRVSRDECFF